MLPTVEETRGYDFQDPENAEKWKGLFVNPLKKVLEQVHPSLNAEESALEYVESLCLRLLAMLCAAPSPLTVQDVEERVSRTFPVPLDTWALQDARDVTLARRRRAALPLDKLHSMLQKEVLLYKIDMSVSVFMTAILEYVSADIFKLAGNFVKKISQKSGYETVTCRDIKTAMCADKVLMDMFYQEWEAPAESSPGTARRARRGSLSYADLVRDLLADEKHFLRDLNLIIRVFKDELENILEADTRAISLIFGNIVDIYELTVTLLGNLEDAMEMSQDSPTPYIGSCFEELAEVEEFRAYVRYANIVTRKESRDALQNIVDDPVLSERLDTAGHGFRLAVKYYLPRLLLAPVAHVFLYHSYVLALLQIAPANDDRESFKQVECNLHPIKKLLIKALGNGPKVDTLRMAGRARRALAMDKCSELARTVDNWEAGLVAHCCNEFIREDTLSKIGPGKRIAERRAYLFDGLLLLCKPVTSLVGVGNSGGGGSFSNGMQQLKLKEKLHVRKISLVDRADTDEWRHVVEVWSRGSSSPVLLGCGSCQEKRNWMCDLVMLNTKPMLDRSLDSILLDLEKRHPLQLPPAELYRFAVQDSPDNILLEKSPTGVVPLIKGATLLKLVERLTYHIYADLNLVRTFLTTYRSFCSASELIDLLIERFHIPEPGEVYDAPRHAESIESVASSDAEKLSKNTAREDWKRYRKEFQQPVQFRVINVFRHWVDQHFYDFEGDPALLARLRRFLESVDGKPMRKWVQSVLKTLHRKSIEAEVGLYSGVAHVFDRAPPAVLRHVADPPSHAWHPLALHPVELARQLTLLEFHMYRLVKPSELVGAVWTKKDKEKTSPNLLKIIKHTTNFTRWMEKWIIESENLEERVAVVCRILELGLALRDLNNFNAVLAVWAACGSAAVHRLKTTFQMVPLRLTRALDEFRSLNSDHFRRYQERLRSINPPCVPFFGMYLTNLLHIEEGNLDIWPDTELINFSKRRKVAEITGEIQQYQNQPYCLTVEPRTRAFLESLDPFPGKVDNEITNYLYEKSLEIEPRPPVKNMQKFPRKYPELSLKQVKASRRHQVHDSAHHNNSDDTLSVSQLSPTGSSAWDGQSVASLAFDDHRGSIKEDRAVVSPRLERCSLSQLSLFDKGLALFDKTKPALAKSCPKDEPPSPRDRHSPRQDRVAVPVPVPAPALSVGKAAPALSPRNAIIDSELFYSKSNDHLANNKNNALIQQMIEKEKEEEEKREREREEQRLKEEKEREERVPPLLPRNSSGSNTLARQNAPPRPHSPHHASSSSISDPPPEPPDRPLTSPKPDLSRMPAISPKRSPAPQPPSPAVQAERALAFSFPSPPPPAPAPHHHSSASGTPPPLPPRRRRDSTAPHTPLHLSSSSMPTTSGASPIYGSTVSTPVPTIGGGITPTVGGDAPTVEGNAHAAGGNSPAVGSNVSTLGGNSPAVGGTSPAMGGNLPPLLSNIPPPLPPRPLPAPALLRPAHSSILLRRQHTNNNTSVAPRLPPKPPPVSPRP